MIKFAHHDLGGKSIRLWALFLTLLLCNVTPTSAATALNFIEKSAFTAPSPRIETALNAYEFDTITHIDLNNDGLDEYILQSPPSPQGQSIFIILSINNAKAVKLGDIQALNLKPATTKHHGILDLYAYTNPNNDFAHRIYTWHALSSSYRVVNDNNDNNVKDNAL